MNYNLCSRCYCLPCRCGTTGQAVGGAIFPTPTYPNSAVPIKKPQGFRLSRASNGWIIRTADALYVFPAGKKQLLHDWLREFVEGVR